MQRHLEKIRNIICIENPVIQRKIFLFKHIIILDFDIKFIISLHCLHSLILYIDMSLLSQSSTIISHSDHSVTTHDQKRSQDSQRLLLENRALVVTFPGMKTNCIKFMVTVSLESSSITFSSTFIASSISFRPL